MLSVIITTFNEEANLARALDSVRWVDDILVVDSFSTDATLEIAARYGVRVEQRAYQGPADQKNWAIPRARREWVLLLDADEVVTPALRAEIEEWLGRPDIPYDLFWIGRTNYFMGQAIRHSGWGNDAVIRFFRRDRARYRAVQVHEEIDTTGQRVGRLQAKLDHYTYRDLDHFLDKMRRYADWSAQDHAARTGRITLYHLWLKPAFRFFKHYVLQRGFLDGRAGFIVSVIMAWGVFLRYAKMKEARTENI